MGFKRRVWPQVGDLQQLDQWLTTPAESWRQLYRALDGCDPRTELFKSRVKPLLRKRFTELRIGSSDQLGDDGVEVLTTSPWSRSLRTLDISGCQLTDADAAAIATSRYLRWLQELDLSYNPIGDDGVAALAASSKPKLSLVFLTNNQIGPRGLAALAASERWPSLRDLYLDENPIGDDGLEALAASPLITQLASLCMNSCEITDRGVLAMLDAPQFEGLSVLGLADNRITDVGAAAIARCPLLGRMTDFGISHNPTTDAGLWLLATGPGLRESARDEIVTWREVDVAAREHHVELKTLRQLAAISEPAGVTLEAHDLDARKLDRITAALATHGAKLRRLDLRAGFHQELSLRGVDLRTLCPNLVDLRLDEFDDVAASVFRHPCLNELALHRCHVAAPAESIEIGTDRVALDGANLRKLLLDGTNIALAHDQRLAFGRFSNIQDVGIYLDEDRAEHYPESIVFDGCPEVAYVQLSIHGGWSLALRGDLPNLLSVFINHGRYGRATVDTDALGKTRSGFELEFAEMWRS